MSVVLDASVVIKWLLQDPQNEPGTEQATRLMKAVAQGAESVVQPPHWLAEVAAVLARSSPGTAAEDVMMLRAMDFPVADDPGIWRHACHLAVDLKQHLFDTLYHAVALDMPGAVLVTADIRYFRAARTAGSVVSLADWAPHR